MGRGIGVSCEPEPDKRHVPGGEIDPGGTGMRARCDTVDRSLSGQRLLHTEPAGGRLHLVPDRQVGALGGAQTGQHAPQARGFQAAAQGQVELVQEPFPLPQARLGEQPREQPGLQIGAVSCPFQRLRNQLLHGQVPADLQETDTVGTVDRELVTADGAANRAALIDGLGNKIVPRARDVQVRHLDGLTLREVALRRQPSG